MTKAGTGTLALAVSNAATFTGSITVSAGTLRTDVAGALGNGAVTVNGGTLALNSINQSVASLAGTGTVNLDNATLTAGTSNASTSFSGSINGFGGLTKTGTGILSLGGANTYSGATIISGGTLRLEAIAPAAKANWSASTLTGTTGSSVAQWRDQISGINANTFNNSPTLGVGTLGGQNVVQFNGTQALEIAAASSPIGNLSNYTVALVFRTSLNGVGGATNWYQNSGLVDAEQGGVTNDWGVVFDANGEVGAGNGNPDQSIYSAGGLANGIAHVVLFSASDTQLTLNVDGTSTSIARNGLAARNVSRVLFGSMNAINYFTGDIAQIAMYDTGLTGQRLNLAGAALANTYGLAASTNFNTTLSEAISDASAVSLSAAGTTLDVNGLNETIGSLSGVTGSSATLGSGFLTTGADNSDTTFLGAITGTGGIVKTGTGRWKAGGANTYSGSTRVDGGSLIVNGSLSGTISVAINAGATLSGTGIITTGSNGNVTVASGGSLAPGETTGKIRG